LMQRQSVPACTSLGCSKGSAAKPPTDTVPTTGNWGKMDSDWGINHAANYGNLVQGNSVPACTSYECKKESMAFPPDTAVTNSGGKMDSDWGINHGKNFGDGPIGNLIERDSIPACTSVECKTKSNAYPPSTDAIKKSNYGKENSDWGILHDGIYSGEEGVVTSAPGIATMQTLYRPGCDHTGCNFETAAAQGWEEALNTGASGSISQDSAIVNGVIDSFRLNQLRSVPACTSLGCKKESMAKAPTDTLPLPEPTRGNWGKMDSDWGIYHAADYGNLVQLESIPSCNSVECFTGTAA